MCHSCDVCAEVEVDPVLPHKHACMVVQIQDRPVVDLIGMSNGNKLHWKITDDLWDHNNFPSRGS